MASPVATDNINAPNKIPGGDLSASQQALLSPPTGATNPYPKGISVSGTGPNNTATNWGVQWDPLTGTWGAMGPNGLLPIYTADQFKNLVPNMGPIGGAADLLGGRTTSMAGTPLPEGGLVAGTASEGYAAPSGGGPGGNISQALGEDVGSATTGYKLDPTTGYYIPSWSSGYGPTGTNQEGAAVEPFAAGFGLLGAGAAGLFGTTLPDVFNAPTLPASAFGPDAAGALPDVFNAPTLPASAFGPDASLAPAATDPISAAASGIGPPATPLPDSALASIGAPVSDVSGPSGFGGLGITDPGAGGLSILPATGLNDITALNSDLANTLGVADTSAVDDFTQPLWSDPTVPSSIANYTPPNISSPGIVDPSAGAPLNIDSGSIWNQIETGVGGAGASALKWAGKNPASAGLLGLSLVNSLKKPALPSAASNAVGTANALNPAAQSTIQSGGTSAPQWAQQKSSIDASIDQQVQQLTEQLMQAQINSGAGGADSVVTQQKIAQLKSTLETQRQQLYLAAQAQNVAQAIQVMSGNNQVLMQTAQMQLQQSEQAMAAAMQTAELALLLAGGGSPTFKIG